MSLSVYGNRLRVRELVFCPAVAIYNRLQYIPVRINFPMQMGSQFEQYLYKNKYRYCDGWLHNILIVHNELLEGHPDFYNPVSKELIEAKCRQSMKIQPYDVAQAGLYAEILKLEQFKIVVGYPKNGDWNLKTYDFKVKHEIFPKMIAHAERLKKQIEEGRIWDKQWDYCPRYPWECKTCPYQERCEK